MDARFAPRSMTSWARCRPLTSRASGAFVRAFKHQFDKLTDELGKTYTGVSVEDAENEIKEILEETKRK